MKTYLTCTYTYLTIFRGMQSRVTMWFQGPVAYQGGPSGPRSLHPPEKNKHTYKRMLAIRMLVFDDVCVTVTQ